jgi:antirestriction protein ArdC
MLKPDIHQTVTNHIIAAMESGALDPSRRWIGELADPKRVTGEAYRGINWLVLGVAAKKQGFVSPTWMTFKQALALGGCVRKGQHGTPVTFAKPVITTEKDEASGEDRQQRGGCILRGYTVFNVDQIDGLGDQFAPSDAALLPNNQRNEEAERALRHCGATIHEGGLKAFYSSTRDEIRLPDHARFVSTNGYLATLAHELVHWTGAEHRLARGLILNETIQQIAQEELIAEIGAAFVCARLGIAGDHIESHADYISHWLQALKNDKRAIFRAASAAQKAADLILATA